MSNQFNTFDNSESPELTNELVGFGDVAGTVKEKRWLVSVWKTFWQGVLNITLLDREKDNYLSINGSTGGAGTVTVSALGSSTDIDLILLAKGAGFINLNSPVELDGTLIVGGVTTLNGAVNITGASILSVANNVAIGGNLSSFNGTFANDVDVQAVLTVGSISIDGSSNSISTAGGLNINVGTGNVDFGTGNFTLTGTNLSAIGGSWLINSANVTIFGGDLNVNGGTLIVNDIQTGLNYVGVNDKLVVDEKLYATSDIISDTFLRAGASIGQTADVSSVQGGGLISKQFNQYSTVANIGDCATLPLLATENPGAPSADYDVYMKVVVRNDGANAMDVFPNVGGTIDGGAADAAVSVAAGAVTTFYGQDVAGVNTWFTA